MRPLITLPLLCLSLAACIPMGLTPAPTPLADLGACGGNPLHVLVGQPATTLPDKGGWTALRVIKPGMMVTMDYSATRLNVRVDGAGRILALDCG
jgi:hypothetical protein